MKKLLRSISKHTEGRYNYVEVKKGIPYYVTTGKRIPKHCIRFPRYKNFEDGFYSLHKYTCGDKYSCKIGKPSSNCVKMGIVSPRQCGKYTLNKFDTVTLSIKNISELIKEFKD